MTLLHAALGHGRDNARSLSDIAEQLGTSRRHVELAIRELRLAGEPIASDGSGVWVTDVPEELEATYRSLRRRVAQQSVTAWRLRQTARRLRGGGAQEVLPWAA